MQGLSWEFETEGATYYIEWALQLKPWNKS